MRELKNLKIKESIVKSRLIFDESISDKMDRYIQLAMGLSTIFYSIMAIKGTDFNSENDVAIALTVFPLLILSSLFLTYRKFTELNLFLVKSELGRSDNRNLLLKFADEEEFEIYRKSEDCVILLEDLANDMEGSKKRTSYIFLLADNGIYVSVIRDQYRLNMPSFLSWYMIRRDIKKLVRTTK